MFGKNSVFLKSKVAASTAIKSTLALLLMSLSIGLVTPVASDAQSTISFLLPVEVFTSDSSQQIATRQFVLDSTQASHAIGLYLQLHGLKSEQQASVQINNGPWINITNTTASVNSQDKRFGGIGATAVPTLRMNLNNVSGFIAGTNTINFRVNGVIKNGIGYRVVDFNVLDSSAQKLLSSSTLVAENPSTWLPPYSDSNAINQGKSLYNSSILVSSPGGSAMRATCADCHTTTGFDLKYFNYSNNAIVKRSMYHGLSQDQGNQIASYIRTLPVSNPGRPWNPPYQPVAGLDRRGLGNWAAGGGLSSVASGDQQMIKTVFPYGITSASIASNLTLNARQTSVTLQLPDWNHWLPVIHPKDYWGSTFENSALRYYWDGGGSVPSYGNRIILASISGTSGSTYAASALGIELQGWLVEAGNFLYANAPDSSSSSAWTANLAEAVYSLKLWQLVKTWESMNVYGNYENIGSAYFGNQSELLTWFNKLSFSAAPSFSKVSTDPNILSQTSIASIKSYWYLSDSWYYLQTILDANDRNQNGTNPIDWGYSLGAMYTLGQQSGYAELGPFIVHMVKGLQNQDNGRAPNSQQTGLSPWWIANINSLVFYPYIWQGNQAVSNTTKLQIIGAFIDSWLVASKKFPPQAYYDGGMADPSAVTYQFYGTQPVDVMATEIIFFQQQGVDSSRISQLKSFAATIWPNIDWNNVHQ